MNISPEQTVANATGKALDEGPRDRPSPSFPWALHVCAMTTTPPASAAGWRCNGFYRTRKAALKAGKGWSYNAVGKVAGL